MDAPKFISEFGHIANAPGGIAQLRLMIYQLAVTGLLTSRGEEQIDAGSLLVETESIRQGLIRDKQYKRIVKLESESIRIPSGIELPPTWRWSRLLDLGEINPRNDAQDEASAAFLPMSGVPQRHRGLLEIEPTKWADIKQGYTHFALGDVVLAKITPCFENGKAAIVSDLPDGLLFGAGTTELHVVRPLHPGILPAYLYIFLRSPLFTVEGENGMTGTAGQKRVPTDYFATRALPLPPTEEQVSIVAKVDELMALCDTLDTQQKERRKLQNALRQSTLQTVAAASSPRELETNWARLQHEFGAMFSRSEDLDSLRQLVMDFAVSGYFSEQDEADEPATELLAIIRRAKEKGIAEGFMARKKHVKPEVLEDTILPPHWESVVLDEAISTIDAGWSPECLNHPRRDEFTWGVLKTTSVQQLRFLPNEHKELPASLSPRPQYEIRLGDILITRAGPKHRVGICCVVDVAPPRLMISDKLIRFHIVNELVEARFVALCLSAGEPGRILERLKSGMADSQMNISQDKLRSITIPLPPLLEQRRVLQNVERMMETIDTLERQRQGAMRLSESMASAAVATLAGITLNKDKDEPVKAPETELIAPLRMSRAPDVNDRAPLAALLARHNGEMSARDLWQRYGGDIDTFYGQLKREVAHGWVTEPEVAEVREKAGAAVGI